MKPGPKPKGKVKIAWSPKFAYAIGLLVADGCLSKDGRHIDLTSKDQEQLNTFNKCLNVDIRISAKLSGSGNVAYHVQFGDVLFYQFLMSIGLSPAKSKTISEILIPKQYFFDFLRGYFDGDGCSCSFYDSVWVRSYRFYISFASGSIKYICWLRSKLKQHAGIKGHICLQKNSTNYQLKYAKKEAIILAQRMYYDRKLVCLQRKAEKVRKSLYIIRRGGEIGKHTSFRS